MVNVSGHGSNTDKEEPSPHLLRIPKSPSRWSSTKIRVSFVFQPWLKNRARFLHSGAVSARSASLALVFLVPWLLGADDTAPKPAVSPLVRAKMLMALLALVVLGIGLVAAAILGGWMVRRLARQPVPPSRVVDDAWYAKPLVPPPLDEVDEGDGPDAA